MKNNAGVKTLNYTGYFVLTLGIIHVLYIFFDSGNMFKNIDAETKSVFLFMFIATSIATMFSGALTICFSKIISNALNEIQFAVLLNLVFIVLIGSLAIIFMDDNPFSYLIFIAGAPYYIGYLKIKKGVNGSKAILS
jgi:hypothetical protein